MVTMWWPCDDTWLWPCDGDYVIQWWPCNCCYTSKCSSSYQSQKPSLCKICTTKTALEGLIFRLETWPRWLWLWEPETQTVQMRPSETQSEVVTNWQIFQKPLPNQKIFQVFCTKMALPAKPCVCMTWETTQNDRLDLLVAMPPWTSKLEMVTNWQIFQKLTTTSFAKLDSLKQLWRAYFWI